MSFSIKNDNVFNNITVTDKSILGANTSSYISLLDEVSRPLNPTGLDQGLLWTQSGTPDSLFFTDNQGTNHNLLSGTTPPLPSQTLAVFVNFGGNDITGNGTIDKPYLTITKAMASITDATPFKRYVIYLYPPESTSPTPASYTDNFSLKANVVLVGSFQSTVRLSGTIDINDPSWYDPTGNNDNRSGFMNLSLVGTTSFNFLSQSSGAGKLYFYSTGVNNNMSFTGFSNINQVRFTDCLLFSGLSQNGVNMEFFGTQFVNGGTVALTSGPNSNTLLDARGGGLGGGLLSIIYTAANPYIVSASIETFVIGTCIITGSSASLIADLTSLTTLPVISSGGSYSIETPGGGLDPAVTATGNSQGTAYQIIQHYTNITSVPASTGVILPSSILGYEYAVKNTTGTACNVYPPSGSSINALGANIAYSLGGTTSAHFVCVSSTNWQTF